MSSSWTKYRQEASPSVEGPVVPPPVATYELFAFDGAGVPMPIQVALSMPVPSKEVTSAWECAVEIRPIWSRPQIIYGEGSFQALCLAARHVVQTLDTFMAHGGCLKSEDGAIFDPEVFGFRLIPRES